MNRIGVHPRMLMDMQEFSHSPVHHRNDMSCCSHVEHHCYPQASRGREARHRHCTVHRPAPADACGPFCREWHNEVCSPHIPLMDKPAKVDQHIYPDDEPPPSHIMGKGKYNPLYKTEMCRNWSEMGHCRYGRTCQFAHGRSELRQVSRNSQWKAKPCGSWLNGMLNYGHFPANHSWEI